MRQHDTDADTTVAILNGESTALQAGITPLSAVPSGILCELTARIIERASLAEMVRYYMLLATVAFPPGEEEERPDDIGPVHLRAVVKKITENPEVHVSVVHVYGLFAEDLIEVLQESGNLFDYPISSESLDALEEWAAAQPDEDGKNVLLTLAEIYRYIVRGRNSYNPAWAPQNPKQFCSVLRTEAQQGVNAALTMDKLRHAAFIFSSDIILKGVKEICRPTLEKDT